MARRLQIKTNVIAPGGNYPYGRIQDDSGLNDGTPVNEEVYGDFHQFFAKMLAESGLTANDLPENSANGFQYYEALLKVVSPPFINTGVTFQTGVISGGGFYPFRYKVFGNEVTLSGTIIVGLTAVPSGGQILLGSLPAAMRPLDDLYLPCVKNSTTVEACGIDELGNFWINSGVAISASFTFDGITYRIS